MRLPLVTALTIGGLLAAAPVSARTTVPAGRAGTDPLTRDVGAGRDSTITGESTSGRGGTGGAGGGATTNGTADGAGTATGGNAGGYPDRGGGGG